MKLFILIVNIKIIINFVFQRTFNMKKWNKLEFAGKLSSIGMTCWVLTGFGSGMILLLVICYIIVIPMVFVYVIFLIYMIIIVGVNGIRANKSIIIYHAVFFMSVLLLYLYSSDIFKSRPVLEASLKDDLSFSVLTFREDGTCDHDITMMFGLQENFKGAYYFRGDTIIFTKVPYDVPTFIPDTILVDKSQDAIFLYKDSSGNFRTQPQWLNHFKIRRYSR